jgi:hypothetical protein
MTVYVWTAEDRLMRREVYEAARMALARYNRAIIAERVGWPAGALETCERLEFEHPEWMLYWQQANDIKGWERPAGYSASRDDVSLVGGDELRRQPEDGVRRSLCVFAPDPAELVRRIAAAEDRVALEREREQQLWRSVRNTPAGATGSGSDGKR